MEVNELVIHHVIGKLSSQQAYLLNLRNQASISAAITGLVATFFGTLISNNREVLFGTGPFGLSLFAVFAFILFGASIAFSAAVVVHTHDFTFSFNGEVMLMRSKICISVDDFVHRYVEDGEWFFKDNERLIEKARNQLMYSLICGFSQIIPWTILVIREVKP